MKFREMQTKKGTKMILGRDEDQNEKLVKMYLGKSNFILHTAAAGSPFCIIEGKPKLGDKKRAAIACAYYSRDWKKNRGDVNVHLFTGKTTYKKKGMPKGTFGVKKFKIVKVKKKDLLRFEKGLKK